MGTESIPDGTKVEPHEGITFSTTVNSNSQATRAANTIIHKGQTWLLPTSTSKLKVGIFGCYTGQYTWEALERLKTAEEYSSELSEFSELSELTESTSPKFSEKKAEILKSFYSATQMYNVPATIETDGSLSYTPQQFWPNNTLTGGSGHEYMTFWAYYPYNETSTLGKYGISITEETTGLGKGMGKVKFTMNPDAAEHNDFLISAPVMDCNRDKYPLQRTDNTPTYAPKPVQFRLYHMLAQVRMYAYIRGDDKMVYTGDADATWFDSWALNGTIKDAWGNVYTKKGADQVEQTTRIEGLTPEQITDYNCGDLTKAEFLALGLKVPDESQCIRWKRTEVWDLNHARRRADIVYSMELNNIHTTTEFYPQYYGDGVVGISYNQAQTLGSVTINHYIMNPYWFTFKDGKRERLNDNYMFDFFEDTPVGKTPAIDATTTMTGYNDVDGINWSSLTPDPLDYLRTKNDDEKKEIASISDNTKHYNFAPGNIILVVPQTLKDDDVPNVVISAKGPVTQNGIELPESSGKGTAKVTINLLKMGISWESGYIYCYAFLDDLRPGDDKVRGPESITVLFNSNWYTDQW